MELFFLIQMNAFVTCSSCNCSGVFRLKSCFILSLIYGYEDSSFVDTSEKKFLQKTNQQIQVAKRAQEHSLSWHCKTQI